MAVKHRSSFSLYDDDDDDIPTKTGDEPLSKKLKESDPAGNEQPPDIEEPTTAVDDANTFVEPKRTLFSVLGALRGERPEMEDTHLSLPSFLLHNLPIVSRASLFAIFDGHAGGRASKFCEDRFPKILANHAIHLKNLDSLEKGMKKLMMDTYKSVDDAFLKEARLNKPTWKDGTTATTLFVLNDIVYAANIGDSKAIVCRRKTGEEKDIIIELTIDHNPQKFEERQRISKAGGVVKNGRVDGIIEVSRSIGDGQFKARGVICLPDIKKFTLTDDDKFILIACDGLWKSFSNEDAISFIWRTVDVAKEKEDVIIGGEKVLWQYVASELAAEAVRRRCGDNVSLLIIVIR